MSLRPRSAAAEPVRITTAPVSRGEDLRSRQRRYLISMLVRCLCFVGALLTHGWLCWTLVAGAVVLPYVAVVMANAASNPDPGTPLPPAHRGTPTLPGPSA